MLLRVASAHSAYKSAPVRLSGHILAILARLTLRGNLKQTNKVQREERERERERKLILLSNSLKYILFPLHISHYAKVDESKVNTIMIHGRKV